MAEAASPPTPKDIHKFISKSPLASKKWTAFMWIHTTMVAFLFYHDSGEGGDSATLWVIIAVLGALWVLYIGGVYALDRYRMGVTDIVRAVKGSPRGEERLPLPDPASMDDRAPTDP